MEMKITELLGEAELLELLWDADQAILNRDAEEYCVEVHHRIKKLLENCGRWPNGYEPSRVWTRD
jgi:hypothetical protein